MLHLFITGSPERQAWLMRLGQRFAKQGYHRVAELALRQALTYGEPTPTLCYELGRSQSALGLRRSARDSLRRGLGLKPNFYLCRRLLLDVCRDAYWAGDDVEEASPIPPHAALVEAHAAVRAARLPILEQEMLRIDDDTLDQPVVARLRRRLELSADRRGTRELAQRLEASSALLDEAGRALGAADWSEDLSRVAELHTRGGEVLRIVGLHDADDLIGYHLEAVHEDGLRFIPLRRLREIRFGRRSDYYDAILVTDLGQTLEVAVPLSYHGSEGSAIEDVRAGEVTVLQRLVPTLSVGLGRRSFMGRDAASGERRAVAIQDVLSVRF